MVWLLGVKLLKPIYKKILVVLKRVLRLVYFPKPRAHSMPLFTSSKILPLNMLYVETVSSIMFDVSRMTVPSNIRDLFTKTKEKHMHKARFSSSSNFYMTTSRLSQTQGYFARFGAQVWNSIHYKFRQLPKRALKKHINNILLSIKTMWDNCSIFLFFVSFLPLLC